LNPSVEVSADTGDVADKDETYFNQFDVVVLIGAPLKQMVRVNEICRALDKKFFCGDTFGFHGFTFSDLIHHTYAE
jgi:ubiquitin-like 1-activating enzyme E1 A